MPPRRHVVACGLGTPLPHLLAFLALPRAALVEAKPQCDGGSLAQCRCLLSCPVFGAAPEKCDGGADRNAVVSDAMMEAVLKPNSDCDSIQCIVDCSRHLHCLDHVVSQKCFNVKAYDTTCDVACEDTTTTTTSTNTRTTTTRTLTTSTSSTSTHSTTTTLTTTSSTTMTSTITTSTATTSTTTTLTTTTRTQTTTPYIVISGISFPTSERYKHIYAAGGGGGFILLCSLILLCKCHQRDEAKHHLLVPSDEPPPSPVAASAPLIASAVEPTTTVKSPAEQPELQLEEGVPAVTASTELLDHGVPATTSAIEETEAEPSSSVDIEPG